MRRARCTSISPGTLTLASRNRSRDWGATAGRADRFLPCPLLLPAAGLAGTGAHALLLLHGLRHALCALAHRLERAALRVDRTVGIAFAELAFRLAHRFAGAAELIHFATLLALLARLLTHAALAQFLHQLVELLAQRLLILAQFAHILLA